MRVAQGTRILSVLRKNISLLNWLRIIWILVVLWFEYGLFTYSLASCGWGNEQLSQSTAPPHRVLLVTDPQVWDLSSSGQGILVRLRHWLYHDSLRKNWVHARSLRPDTIIFLGDIIDSGRKIQGDDAYRNAVRHFRQLFSTKTEIDTYFVPGNEDVGLNLLANAGREARDRYFNYFGPANTKVALSNHTLVFLDAPLLVEEDYRRAKLLKGFHELPANDGGSVAFIRSFKDNLIDNRQPVILFTHIPLARPETATCGPLRESGTIHRGAGPGYQNTLGKLTTEFIFEHIKPSLIFSGDDRDYCDYTHLKHAAGDNTKALVVREVTVKSFSPYKHIRSPGFHLLSLVSPHSVVSQPASSVHTFTDSPCFLPSQASIYMSVYIPLSLITLAALIVMTLRQPGSPSTSLLPSPSMTYKGRRSPSPYRRQDRESLISPVTPTSPWRMKGQRFPSLKESSSIAPRRPVIFQTWRIVSNVLVTFLIVILPSVGLWTCLTWISR
ncbi:Metallo-dependent phosphatase-like protein [Cytidiella melzeri]|nr:Metallo-dependent phosphatase-like protein [Cytidiella melzeri]